MFTDNLFGGKPPAPGEPRRSPLGNLAASILAVDVKIDRHANDGTVHVTKAEKEKLDRIPEGATANVQSDWDQSDSDADDFIRNKPPAMRSPAALSFGQKTYDGSAAKTITAADLGALTAHQDISGKADKSTTYTKTETDSAISAAIATVTDSAPAAFDTLKEIADWIGDSGSGAQAVINQVAGKANKVASATSGNFAGLDANGNLTDSGKKASDFATVAQGAKADTALQSGDIIAPSAATASGKAADALAVKNALALKADASSLPYALVDVTPTDKGYIPASAFPVTYYDFDDVQYTIESSLGVAIVKTSADDDASVVYEVTDVDTNFIIGAFVDGVWSDSSSSSWTSTPTLGFTPTYELSDRTTNQVVIASPLPENGIALSFPEATAGKVRDFLVRLVIPAGDAPQIAYPSDVKFGNGAGEFPEINTTDTTGATAETILMFTETAPYVANATPAKFFVKGEAWNEIGGAA